MAVEVEYHRNQILENCRWLFGQEVQLITVPRGNKYSGLILPKSCSLKSMTQCDISEKILFEAESDSCSGYGSMVVIWSLLDQIEERIAEVLQRNEDGVYSIDKSMLRPTEYTEDISEEPSVSRTDSEAETEAEALEGSARRRARRARRRRRRETVNPQDAIDTADITGTADTTGTAHPTDPTDSTDTPYPTAPSPASDRPGTQSPTNDPNDSPPIILPPQAHHSQPPQSPGSNSIIQFTPSVSAASDTTTTAAPDELAELNRRVIREEINLALRGIFSGLIGPGQ